MLTNVNSMFIAVPKLYTLMVFDEWHDGILVDFIVNEKSWKSTWPQPSSLNIIKTYAKQLDA